MKISDAHLKRSRRRCEAPRPCLVQETQGMVEPVIGTLKEQRGCASFSAEAAGNRGRMGAGVDRVQLEPL